jgi:non-specific protein-tyrosine kinase
MQLIDAVPELQGQQGELRTSIDVALRSTREQIDATQREIDDLAALSERTPDQETRLTALDARLVTLRSTFASLVASTSGFDTTELTLIEPAVPPTTPISPRTLLNVLIGALLGLFAGVALVLIRERLDDTVKTPADAEQTVGLPALGVITQMPGDRKRNEIYRLAALLYPRSPATETYRMLRANIEFATADTPMRSLLVTSSAPSEGKTVTCSNLAIVFAQAGHRVLLIDGDLRRPGIHRLFDIPNTQGLSTLLRTDDVDYAAAVRPTEQANLWVLPTGPLPADPAELVGSPRMVAVMEHLESGYDLIIVDSPPVQSVADAAILSSFLDATLLVIGAGRARRTTLRLAREALDRAGADVIGVVLNLLRDPAAVAYGGHYPSYMTDEAEHDEGFTGGPGSRPSSQTPGA